MTTGTIGGTIRLKHMCSSARDAEIAFEIDWPAKVVTITVQGRRPFIPTDLLRRFITFDLPHGYGINAWDDDNTPGMLSLRADWNVLLVVGDLCFAVKLVKQVAISADECWALELDPVSGDGS